MIPKLIIALRVQIGMGSSNCRKIIAMVAPVATVSKDDGRDALGSCTESFSWQSKTGAKTTLIVEK